MVPFLVSFQFDIKINYDIDNYLVYLIDYLLF